MLTAVVMAAVVILVACGSDSKNGRKKNPADNSDENLTLYYANSTWTDLFPEVFTRDQLVTTENLIDTVMNALMDSGEMTDKQVPVPQGVTYQRYTYDGQATINLMFNVDWEATDTYEMVLSKAAFVRTLTQIESVKKVVYEYTDIANENSIVREELTNDSFSDMDNFMNPHEEYNIYMPDSTGQKLVQKTIDLDRSAPESLEEQMVAGLRMSYDGTVAPFNEKTVVKSVTVDDADGVCTITFNESFADGTAGVDDEILVYSVVDSLMELEDVKRVQINVDNTNNRLNNIDLSRKFTADYSKLER